MINLFLNRIFRAIKIDIEEWKKWAVGRGWTEYGINNYQNMCQHYDEHGYKYANIDTYCNIRAGATQL